MSFILILGILTVYSLLVGLSGSESDASWAALFDGVVCLCVFTASLIVFGWRLVFDHTLALPWTWDVLCVLPFVALYVGEEIFKFGMKRIWS